MNFFNPDAAYEIKLIYLQFCEDFGTAALEKVRKHVKHVLHVTSAKDAIDAIKKDTKYEIDILLTDVWTDELTTFATLNAIRKVRPKLLALIMTPLAHNRMFEYISAIDAKNDYILEPLDEKQFCKVLARNITKMGLARQAERTESQLIQYRHAINDIAQVMIATKKWVISDVNQNYLDLFGYEKYEILGQKITSMFDEDLNPGTLQQILTTLKHKEAWRGRVICKSKKGSILYGHLTILPIQDAENEIVEYLLVRTDSTQLVKKSIQATNSERAKDVFLANMSHEMRTPLNGIIGYAQLLQKLPLQAQAQKFSNTIASSGMQLLGIINDILDYSKIYGGHLSLAPVSTNLKKELENVERMFSHQAEEKNIIYRFLLDPTIPDFLVCDGLRIKQIMINLLSNAMKFAKERVVVQCIFMKKEGDAAHLLFSVADDGIGISKEEQEHIYKPFSQASSVTSAKYGGTGLGLAIVQELINKMGSTMILKSAPNEGSTFSFNLKLKYGMPSLEIISETQELLDFSGTSVLLAEDNKINQELMVDMLKRYHIDVTCANDGREAIEFFTNHTYNLVLMDINMPTLDGIKATQKILDYENSKQLYHTPIVALTANVSEEEKEHYLAIGMDGHLGKPFTLSELEHTLGHYIACQFPPKNSEQKTQINFEEISRNTGIAQKKIKYFLEKFANTLEEDIPRMQSYLEQNQLEDLGSLAHKLKGSAGLLDQAAIRQECMKIEKSIKENSPCDYALHLQNIQKAFISLKTELQQHNE